MNIEFALAANLSLWCALLKGELIRVRVFMAARLIQSVGTPVIADIYVVSNLRDSVSENCYWFKVFHLDSISSTYSLLFCDN
ncbi:hypothetical protein VCRA2113O324_460004 [Vibrio crassostreae]|nr:hypothetical protein VCRA2113O324_460004 [Vibrio crassostreae]CAK2131034.1 hypothetical protein VCRA2111O320_450004 [Vibrio crassostreae]CAK3504934.1 hypothetical protein VCRA2120O329_450007 [Vibrio crassostreae]CAK3969534.1 hypothetical protein VCRA2128O347_470007 [Vibrio crassostreae]